MYEHKDGSTFLVCIVDVTCVVLVISGHRKGSYWHVHVGVNAGFAHAPVRRHQTVVELVVLGTDGTLLGGVQVVRPGSRRLKLLECTEDYYLLATSFTLNRHE